MPAKSVTKATTAKSPSGAAKKKAVVVSPPEEPTPTTPKASKQTKRGAAARAEDDVASLAAAIVEGLSNVGSSVVGSLADQVMRQYENDAPTAVATLVSVLCRSSGIPHDVPAERIDDEGNINVVLEEVLAHAPTTMTTYPLINKEQKKFKKAFSAFFERIMELAYNAALLEDGVFLESWFPWASAMIESKARNFRHTATAAVFAMVSVLSNLVERGEEAVNTAKTKKDAAAAKARLEIVTNRHKELLNGTLHQRCKDTSPDIRLLAFQTLRHLIVSNPRLHVANHYLRYLSIAINDKKVEIRVEGLDIIAQVLGTHPTYAPRMRDYLKHVVERIVELTADVETKVADIALKVAALVVKSEHDTAATDNVLDEDRLDRVLTCISDDRRVIRTTAGTLLKIFIRCRVDSASGPRGRADILVSFASTLRASYREAWAERYIVDALWGESPPALLTDFKHFLAIAQQADSDPLVTATALFLVAHILQRCNGELDFGPAAKDDMRTIPAAGAEKTKVDEKDLRAKITKEAGNFLADLLEKFGSEETVVGAVAAVIAACDLEQFAGTRSRAQLEEILGALRRVTLNATDADTLDYIGAAWKHLVLTESPSRMECEEQFQLVVKAVLKQAQDAMSGKSGRGGRKPASQDASPDASLVAAMRRVKLVSTLASLTGHWSFLCNCLTRFAHETDRASKVSLCDAADALVHAIHATALWFVASNGEGVTSNSEVTSALDDALPNLLLLAGSDGDSIDGDAKMEALALRGAAVCAFVDMVALPFISLSSAQQTSFVSVAIDVVDQHVGVLAEATEALRDATRRTDSPDLAVLTSGVTAARRLVSSLEAATTRIASGVSRLFVFDRLSTEQVAAKWMLLWPRVSAIVKPAGDAFKTLFHVLRDNAKAGPASVEKRILFEGTNRCANLEAHSAALEQLHQLGLKLSSMHFLPTDKYYPAAVAVVESAIEHAKAGDELILHAVGPYCARLKVGDALAINNRFSVNLPFSAPVAEQSPFVRAFISAVRRAAKLEVGGPALTDATPARGGSLAATTAQRTGRTATTVGTTVRRRGTQLEVEDEDDVLAGIVRAKGQKTRPLGASASRTAPPQPSAEAGGWRGRGAPAVSNSPPKMSQSTRGVSTSQQPLTGTQMTASSMLDDQEVFIATQEWE